MPVWWRKILLGLLESKDANDYRQMQEFYRQSLVDVKKELEEAKVRIDYFKKAHPENGKELQEWEAREDHLHKMLIALIQENRDLKEQIIFTRHKN